VSDQGELAGRAAVVTGGTRGIGRAIAETLAGAGAAVLLTGRDAAVAEETARALSTGGRRVEGMAADQGADADWAKVVARAERVFGRLDIVVLNAGVSWAQPTSQMSLDDFRKLNRVNLKGAFLGLKHAVEAMRRGGRGGSVVIVSSIVGAKIGVADHIHYAAAKAGVRMMGKAAALELGPEHIRVNSIHPGMTRTDMTAAFPPELAGMIPLRRYAEPSEIGDAALFLASDRSRFMTGAEIVVDGGWTAR
jgi:NAD(P)-dependent dehydrogenase (short-subunit alcohol dehydrogenase family)